VLVSEKVQALQDKQLLTDAVIQEVVASGGLEGSTKSVDVEQGLEILGRKNDVWMSFDKWYGTLGSGERRYMDLILQAAFVGLEEHGEELTVGRAEIYEDEVHAAIEDGGDDLADPVGWGPISTAITREIIRQTIRRRCATRWAGC
jgi:hypothetical protein